METYNNGHRYENLRIYDKLKHNPYDYKRNGLIKHLVSPRIANTKNPVLRFIVNTVENSIIYTLQYIDILKNYFNYTWYNR